jgi:phosphoribosyl 1,2-cyclic phosphodiesterase
MRVTVLGSGSAGNATLVESDGIRLLVDAGFSGRDLARRLAAVEVEPDSVTALLITHDHGDHTRGMGIFARRWGVPLFLTEPTRIVCTRLLDGSETVHPYSAVEPVTIGGLRVEPFLTVHDAVDPIAVTVTEIATGEKLGIATDLGRPTATVRHALRGCDLLVLEANHDEILLRESPYPWSVKARIASSHGHLSNHAATELARELCHAELGGIVLAHLSERANDPKLAEDVLRRGLASTRFGGRVFTGRQEGPLDPICVESLRNRVRPAQLALL